MQNVFSILLTITISTFFLTPWYPPMSSSPGPELSSTLPPWMIWAPTPVWSPALTASPPATLSQRRVSQPAALASLKLDSLVICLDGVSAKGVRGRGAWRSVSAPVCYHWSKSCIDPSLAGVDVRLF